MSEISIGELSKKSGVSAKLIRHYEKIGLVAKPLRLANGYRAYHSREINILSFIKHSRELDFSLKEIKELLGLWRNQRRSSLDVKKLALAHLKTIDEKIAQLQVVADTLRVLAKNCHGDDRPDCPIIKKLEGD